MRKYNKNKLEELCEEHNIDTDLAEEFIEETNAFPFLLGQPSTYFVIYLKTKKGIDIADKQKQILIESLIKNDTLKNLMILMYFVDVKEIPTCEECNHKTHDYAVMTDQNGKDTIICFGCFLKKYFHILYDVNEETEKKFFMQFSTGKHNFTLQTIILLNLIQYYYAGNEKISTKEFIKGLINNSGASYEKQINKFIRDTLAKIQSIYIYRETHPTAGNSIDIIELIDAISRDEKFINAPISVIETASKTLRTMVPLTGNVESVFGAEIKEWIVEQKTGKMQPAYVVDVIRETDAAILCEFTLLDKKPCVTDWIPKSQIIFDNKNFIKNIIKNTLKTFGVNI